MQATALIPMLGVLLAAVFLSGCNQSDSSANSASAVSAANPVIACGVSATVKKSCPPSPAPASGSAAIQH